MSKDVRSEGDFALILLLAAGDTNEEAAQACGVTARTVRRRLEDPTFRRQVQEARASMFERGIGKLAAGISDAVAAMRSLLEAESDMAKLGAARAILDHAVKLREHAEVNERLRQLEERVAAMSATA